MDIEIPVRAWVAFGAVLLALIAVDLWVHRGERHDSRRTAIVWTVVWIAAGLGFGAFVWWSWGSGAAMDYLAAYLIEKALSVDNLFVFLIIFGMLKIPRENQRTVLSWGIFGALVFRAIFIFLGAAAIERYHWVEYVFAAILLWAAWRTFREDPAQETENRTVEWLSRHLPVTHEVHGDRFVVRIDGRLVATPLLIAVLGLEATDIVFAVDSVPAAFSISHEPFIVYSSNAFAILGLRALYIVLAHTLAELRHLHYGLAAVLAFAAGKMLVPFEIHPLASIAIIVALIGGSVWASLAADQRDERLARLAVEADAPSRGDEPDRGDGAAS